MDNETKLMLNAILEEIGRIDNVQTSVLTKLMPV